MSTDVDAAAPGVGEPEQGLSAQARAAALSAGAPRVPRRAIAWGLAAAAVLALGGTLLERAFTSAGLNPIGPPTTTTLPPGTVSVPLSLPAATLLGPEGVERVRAPSFTLTSQRGARVSLASLRGDVVVLSFFNASCTDQCAVLGRELARADHDLGARGARVVLLTVNTDKLDLSWSPSPPAAVASGLGSLDNWSFLTGSFGALDAVWRAYGVTVEVYPSAHLVVHGAPFVVVAPNGRLALRASPLILQSRSGAYSLPGVLERRAGDGLARELAGLLGRST